MNKNLWKLARDMAVRKNEEWDDLDKYQKEDCVWCEYEKLLKENENMNTKLVCPNCGTEMKLPERSEVVTGVTLSKETGGTHVLEADVIKNNNLNSTKLNNESEKERKTMNRENRMETLMNNGVNVGKYFKVTLPNGETVKMALDANGIPVVVSMVEEDPILNQIIEDGYVRNTKLHRRWVMAQMFQMLNYTSYNGCEKGYDACLRNKYGYMYQFSMMLEEVRVLSKLEVRDAESFNERSHFFTKRVVVETCNDYSYKLANYISEMKVKHCKGVPYKRIKGQDIFVDDLNKKIFVPIRKQINAIKDAKNYTDLFRALKKFNNGMIKLPYDTKKCPAWIDAFKGSGAYYTLKNLVMYHGCDITYDTAEYWGQTVTPMIYHSGTEAVKFIQSKLDKYQGEGWRYLAMLRKCIADNNFNFDNRMKEIYNN